MTRPLFDLGARLHAAHTGRPIAIAAYAPVLPPVRPIAVSVDTDGEHVYLVGRNDTTTASGADRAALAALHELGASMDDTHRTLVVATAREVSVLTALAHRFRTEPASPVVGWWDQRIDYPGTEAVHVVTDAARLRWVLGVHPDRESDLETWRTWLEVAGTGPDALLEMARMTASGSTLLGLLSASGADADAWEKYAKRLDAGRPWWMPDNRFDAAMGLTARSNAAEWYESLRLSDPLVAVAAAHDGTVVPGTVAAVVGKTVTIHADRPLSRLRTDAQVEGWRGEPVDAGKKPCLVGRIQATSIDAHARLSVTAETARLGKGLVVGERLCLRPARVDEYMQSTGRGRMASMYARGTNWLAGRGQPMTRRGSVPLDVVVAAASD